MIEISREGTKFKILCDLDDFLTLFNLGAEYIPRMRQEIREFKFREEKKIAKVVDAWLEKLTYGVKRLRTHDEIDPSKTKPFHRS